MAMVVATHKVPNTLLKEGKAGRQRRTDEGGEESERRREEREKGQAKVGRAKRCRRWWEQRGARTS